MCICIYINIYMYICIYICVSREICIYIFMFMCLHEHVYIQIDMHRLTCINIYIFTHTYTCSLFGHIFPYSYSFHMPPIYLDMIFLVLWACVIPA